MWKPGLAALMAAVALNGIAYADSGWATRSELGYVMARGNTDTESGNVKFDTAHAIGRWKYTLGGSALYATSNHIETAQRWAGHFQTDLNFSDRAFWFAALRYEDDRFSGFAYQESFSTGAGRDFIKSDKTHLMAQLGVGVRKLRSEELFKDTAGAVIQRIPGEPTTDAVANAALVFERQFGASTKLIESLTVESGQANTSTKNNLSLQVRMNETLALAVGFQINNNSSPPPGMVTRTDKLTTINLVYELKNPKFSPTAVSHGPPTVPTLTTAQAASSGSSTGGK